VRVGDGEVDAVSLEDGVMDGVREAEAAKEEATLEDAVAVWDALAPVEPDDDAVAVAVAV
jgi:hypothetical protein